MRLIAENLACERSGRRLFEAVSFSVEQGELLELRGPNGAGKSSLLRMIAGLLRPAEGSIRMIGGGAEPSAGEQAHYVAHADAAKGALTPLENLTFWAGFLGGGDPLTALAKVRLEATASFPAAHLSSGQRRRLTLARLALIRRPLWLLDEPNTGLDIASHQLFAAMLKEHLEAGGLAIAATHIPLGLEEPRRLTIGGRA